MQAPSTRHSRFAQLAANPRFDIAIVGGGATGLGVAVDAATRGLRVLLVEAADYAKGTSSRATKLLHGGVRYLAQGNIALVREALHERTAVLRNAPALAHKLPFVMPSYHWASTPFYGAGLKMYDLLAGQAGLGATEFLSKDDTLRLTPNTKAAGLKGGVKYWDAQFDDARLAWALAATAEQHGAVVLNHCRVSALLYDAGRVVGFNAVDAETGTIYPVASHCVVNATGIWVDELRQQDAQALSRPAKPMVAPSQGVHIVVDKKFWPTDHALMVPKTADGRVLFGVPWLGSVIVGTTDTPRQRVELEPVAQADEVAFILSEAANYMANPPTRADVKSIWVGMRPLVKPQSSEGEATQKLSREHTVLVSKSGLLTVTGGKWTTYRAMAEDVIDSAIAHKLIQTSQGCQTANLGLAATKGVVPSDITPEHVTHMALHEHARTTEDVLARRTRTLFLDAALAAQMAPMVAESLHKATGADPQLPGFLTLARQYQTVP